EEKASALVLGEARVGRHALRQRIMTRCILASAAGGLRIEPARAGSLLGDASSHRDGLFDAAAGDLRPAQLVGREVERRRSFALRLGPVQLDRRDRLLPRRRSDQNNEENRDHACLSKVATTSKWAVCGK